MMNFPPGSGPTSPPRSVLYSSASRHNLLQDNTEECNNNFKRPTYLQALLGDNPPTPGLFDHATISDTSFMTAISDIKEESSVFDDTTTQFDPFKMPSLPSFRRNRSVSMSAAVGSSLSFTSPLRKREHTSEAGSPTLEQVLLMSKSKSPSQGTDYGYGSSTMIPDYNGDGLYSSIMSLDLNKKNDNLDVHEKSQMISRPTFSEIVGIDIAVAEAVQNLQSLKQKQVAIYSEFGFSNNVSQSATTTNATSVPVISQCSSNKPVTSIVDMFPPVTTDTTNGTDPQDLERAARLYRSAASHYEASCTWSGQLPHRTSTASPNSSYSTKLFLGGVPWDISEQTLVQAFAEFGDVRVEWPGRDYSSPPKGYLYLVFEDESDVKDLLAKCSQDFNTRDSYYYKIASRRIRAKDKEVQIIPWVLSDSHFARCQSPRLDPQKTVFVGALHGMMTAHALAVVFNDLFGGVIYAGLDTDKYQYPIGSGRVTFNNKLSFMKAVSAAFIEIKTPRFSKKIQVDPYLEDALCSVCSVKQGPYFCRDKNCFNYYCIGCWDLTHAGIRPQHKPLMRNIRGITRARANYGHHSDYNNNYGGRYRGAQFQDPNRNLADYFSHALGHQ